MMITGFIIAISLIITYISIYFVRKIFPILGLMDNPQKYNHQRKAVPYPAGVIIPLIFFSISFSLIPPQSHLFKPFIGFFIASMVLLTISFIDDHRNLSPFFRLVIQFIIAIIIISFGVGISEIRAPLGGHINLNFFTINFLGKSISPLADILAILWIMGMVNAMNWLDGISGLTSSISGITAIMLSISAYIFGQTDIALLFCILAAICLVFFIFDLDQPKILMGDSGSMFLGLALAVFTIIAGGKVATVFIIMFAPIFDAVFTIIRRVIKGKSPFKGDYEHLHHKLLEKFKSKKKVVLFYVLMVILFGFSALIFKTMGKMIIIGILLIFLTILELYLHKF